ncbi:hypothetical protein LTR56_002050 [Elasticomyces elasticus]|nr:hypothetical protein LTR22_012192 [Elasticomyces elasticus]KAK3658193.1 hypothetical protein LTR56_002050 [Elasticomyces elasticus]KAK4919472.1 hypothetical protein LTR49_012850 [Elasticomyces elasticus]KAK5764078.1 hypothetical protein LTS12_005772 [Elasticomyces elasticus]
MPSSRRMKVTGLIAILTVLIIIYVTNGASNTYNSPFYTRTVEAIQSRQDAEARENVIAEEKSRLDRVERVQKEHDAAILAAAEESGSILKGLGGDAAKAAGAEAGPEKQKPLAQDVKEAASGAVKAAGSAVSEVAEKVKPLAGRKTMQAGNNAADKKVVQTKPASAPADDGVAKVGNVVTQPTNKPGPETEEDHRVETELNDILKKGPIIIFSKSYCPYSKKAKHILLDMYTISPPPYVVELDQHELGQGLQGALHKSTGRRTVPNVLINGKSIGGGDDIEALHRDGKLAETLRSMGGKRVVSVEPQEAEAERDVERAVKFKG